MAQNAPERTLAQLLATGQPSDLTLSCHGHIFEVHKAIVCSQSPVLKAAVHGPFEEARTGIIKVGGFRPETVRQMVEFLYTTDYNYSAVPMKDLDSQAGDSEMPNDELHQTVRVNAIADYYQIPELSDLSRKVFAKLCKLGQTEATVLSAIKEAHATTGDAALHEIMATALAQNIPLLARESHYDTGIGPTILSKTFEKIQAAKLHDQKHISWLEASLQKERTRREQLEVSPEKKRFKDKAHDSLEQLKSCFRCKATFNCHSEVIRSFSTPYLVIRCRGCHRVAEAGLDDSTGVPKQAIYPF
ncbi:uncharacterized protein F5Z01DRAFT_734917 [Emericellopsis atlantica]|uniref:BTB domain-containing protein n=1 Tax=Emericellopsis atlantica TaxID=2614577 RepID=A0A9P7ZQY7_9HYPO|nr:uncharacterized protein F5Z01DRAFT_734917 [Emericellopsis atlantica]KAG9256222.1 hypothetical protein F5Z01DRAFT_734917 [Emericellopsis atlantica]